MVKGKPAHEYVRRIHLQRLAHGVTAGDDVAVGQNHALRVARAPRGVLQKGNVVRTHRRNVRQRAVTAQLIGGGDPSQGVHLRRKQARDLLDLIKCDQRRHPCVFENAGMSAKVILDLGNAGRRINRHRHPAGEKYAQEAEKIIRPGGKHDGHRLARLDAVGAQAGGKYLALFQKFPVAQARLSGVVIEQMNVYALRMASHVPEQRINQVAGASRRFLQGV